MHHLFRHNEIPTVKAIAVDVHDSGDVTPLKPWNVHSLMNDIAFMYEERGHNSWLMSETTLSLGSRSTSTTLPGTGWWWW